jgi:hypothetical protein
LAICCKPRATARRPEPQSWFRPSLDRGLTGRVLTLAGAQDLAQDHFVDIASLELGLFDQALDHGGAQIMSGRIGESAVERADGGAARSHDDDIGCHNSSSL